MNIKRFHSQILFFIFLIFAGSIKANAEDNIIDISKLMNSSIKVLNIGNTEDANKQWENKDRDGFHTGNLVITMGDQIVNEGLGFGSSGFTDAKNSENCANWHVTGVCIFVNFTPVPPFIYPTLSLKISHYNPEAVISVYNAYENSPWKEARKLNINPNKWLFTAVKKIGQKIKVLGNDANAPFVAGENERSKRDMKKKFITNKQADAIGFPDLIGQTFNFGREQMEKAGVSEWITDLVGMFTGFQCPQQNTPFTPHFLSGADFLLWQTGVSEMLKPATYLPYNPLEAYAFSKDKLKKLHRDIRNYSKNPAKEDYWGNVFPRTAWVDQVNDYKASATVAQRVANIITQTKQLHVYIPIGFTSKTNNSNNRKETSFSDLSSLEESDASSFGTETLAKEHSSVFNELDQTGGLDFSTDQSEENGKNKKEKKPKGWTIYEPPTMEAIEGNYLTHKMQLIHPIWEKQCHTFPYKNDDKKDVFNEFGNKISKDGSYSWVLWRPYSCCKKAGQFKVFNVNF